MGRWRRGFVCGDGLGGHRRELTTVNTIERLYRQTEGIQLFQEQSAHQLAQPALARRAAYRCDHPGQCLARIEGLDTQPTDQVEFLAIGLLQRQVIGQSALPLLRPRQSVAQAFTHRAQAHTPYAAGPAPTALSAFVSRAESSTPVFSDLGPQ